MINYSCNNRYQKNPQQSVARFSLWNMPEDKNNLIVSLFQHISFKSLIERNKDAENKGMKPSPSSAIHLPFIVVNTSDKALIDCSISNDK